MNLPKNDDNTTPFSESTTEAKNQCMLNKLRNYNDENIFFLNKDGTFALCILVTGFEGVLQMIKPQTQ